MYCEALKKLQNAVDNDPPFVAIMANGTSGDLNNINFRTPRAGKPPYEQMRYVAGDVAKKVSDALARLTWKDDAALDARYRELPLAWRRIEPELLAWAKETEANAPKSKTRVNLRWLMPDVSNVSRNRPIPHSFRSRCCASATSASGLRPVRRSRRRVWSSSAALSRTRSWSS
ncbi:MAG: hypothetical protein M3463_11160 [Verrucomicrobiota bacterium]|nr:hypothetical protein [Verrucomicrobiota bacterium]